MDATWSTIRPTATLGGSIDLAVCAFRGFLARGGGDGMSGGQFKVSAILGVLSLAFVCAGAAGAQGPARGATEDTTIAGSERMPMLEAKISDQDAALQDSIREISTVGAELDRAQSRADSARARVGDLGRQTRHLKRQIAEQDAAFREAQARYR